MSRDAVESLVDRWIGEPSFRAELRADPEGAVHRTGLELDEEEWSALQSIDWSVSDDQLQGQLQGRSNRLLA